MQDEVVVSTGSRLHFGFFTHRASALPRVSDDRQPLLGKRNFGGVGLMLESPGVTIAVRKSDRDLVECSPSSAGEPADCEPETAEAAEFSRQFAAEAVARYRKACPTEQAPPPCRIEVRGTIPRHRGLGSGTQLAMAVAQALALIAGEGLAGVASLASRVLRGRRSAIGIHGFARGGFLVESGKSSEEEISPLVARVDVPGHWRFLLLGPSRAGGPQQGLSGSAESEALARLPDMPCPLTDKLCGLVLLEMLPALARHDVDRFGEAMYQFSRSIGGYFRPVQGGDYAHAQMADLVDWLRAQGVRGVAQTSWGPTIAVCCADRESADSLGVRIRADRRWQDCSLRTVAPLNTGAAIELGAQSISTRNDERLDR